MWLKIKIWTKSIVAGVLVLYALAFLFKNSDVNANIWYWFFKPKYEVSVLLLTFMVFLAGIVGTLLVRTTITTVRQIRESRARGRTARLEREVAEMKSKASMLKTKQSSSAASARVDDSDPLDELI
jgi:hypothetical protein